MVLLFFRGVQKSMYALALACSSFLYGGDGELRESQKQKKNNVQNQQKNDEKNREKTEVTLYAPLPLKGNAYKEGGKELLMQRLSFHMTNYFTLHNLIGSLEESIEQRTPLEEILGKPTWNELRRSVQEAARETVVQNMRIDDVLERVFSDDVKEKIFNMVGGRPEIGILHDPLDTKGIPGYELHDPTRLPRHWTLEPRLLRTNPSLNWTLRTKPFVTGLQFRRKDAGAVVEVPLSHSWVFTSGFKVERYDNNRAYGYLGLSSFTKKGYLTVGTRIPIRDSNENLLWTSISYSLQF